MFANRSSAIAICAREHGRCVRWDLALRDLEDGVVRALPPGVGARPGREQHDGVGVRGGELAPERARGPVDGGDVVAQERVPVGRACRSPRRATRGCPRGVRRSRPCGSSGRRATAGARVARDAVPVRPSPAPTTRNVMWILPPWTWTPERTGIDATAAVSLPPVSSSEPSREPRGGRPARRRRGGGGSGGSGGQGAGGKSTGGGGGRGKGGARRQGGGTRAKVNPRIQIGTWSRPPTWSSARSTRVSSRSTRRANRSPSAWSHPGSTARPRTWCSTSPRTGSSPTTPHRSRRSGPTCATRSRPRCASVVSSMPTTSRRVRSTPHSTGSWRRSRSVREFAKLGAVVFPFPSYFTPGSRALDYLEWLRGRSGDLPIAIELRHRDWVAGKQRDATMAFLSEHQLAYVCVDVPSGFDSSQPPCRWRPPTPRSCGSMVATAARGSRASTPATTSSLRLQGRRPRAMEGRLEKLAGATKSVHVTFSGRTTEAASRNARLLVRVLSGEVTPEPRPAPGPPRKGRPRPR